MKLGFLSDIHGNYDGLRIALFHLKKLGCEIVCLGDIVSENSTKNDDCIELIRRLNIQTVKGHHDDICAKSNFPPVTDGAAAFLDSLPEMMTHKSFFCVHDNPLENARTGQGMWRSGSYIWSETEASVVFEEFFSDQIDYRYVFTGHSHVPKVFSNTGEIQITYNEPIQLDRNSNYIINPGNIGGVQRRKDGPYSYLIFDTDLNQLTYYRVAKEGRAFAKKKFHAGKSKI